MTLNGLKGIFRYMFTITNGHWLIICYLFTVVGLLHVWLTRDQRRSAGSGVKQTVSRRAAEYLESAENLRIFSGRYIVGTLTNNANVII